MEEKDYFEQLEDGKTVEKYKVGGIIVENIINGILNNVKPQETLNKLYEIGYNLYNIEMNKYFNKKKLVNGKGIAFPLSLSLNNVAGYYINKKSNTILKEGDILKIELGVHIDGYPSVTCITKLVTNDKTKCDKNKLKLIDALNEAKREALKLIKPESSNIKLVKKMEYIANKYGLNLLTCNGKNEKAPGVISYQMSQNVIDGKNDDDDDNLHKLILLRWNETFDFELSENDFEENEVYGIDIGLSTGNGKISKLNDCINIYKRNKDKYYSLKLKSSKNSLSKISGNFPIDISDISTPRLKFGLNECLSHKLVEEYPVMAGKDNDLIGRIKFTVIIRKKTKKNKKGNILITDLNCL